MIGLSQVFFAENALIFPKELFNIHLPSWCLHYLTFCTSLQVLTIFVEVWACMWRCLNVVFCFFLFFFCLFVFLLVTTTLSPGSGHARRCNDTEKTFCVNGGDCYFIPGINKISCKWVFFLGMLGLPVFIVTVWSLQDVLLCNNILAPY